MTKFDRILRDLREGLRGERDGTMPVPIADLRVIVARLQRAERVEAAAEGLARTLWKAPVWNHERDALLAELHKPKEGDDG